MRKKSVYRRARPAEHLVSATFDEPYLAPDMGVVRWRYGESSHETRTQTPPPGFVEWCKERVRQADLEVMARCVWGDATKPDMAWEPPSPEFWAQVANVRVK